MVNADMTHFLIHVAKTCLTFRYDEFIQLLVDHGADVWVGAMQTGDTGGKMLTAAKVVG